MSQRLTRGHRGHVPVGVIRRASGVASAWEDGELSIDARVMVWAAHEARSATRFDARGRTGDGPHRGLDTADENGQRQERPGAGLKDADGLPGLPERRKESNESQAAGEDQR